MQKFYNILGIFLCLGAITALTIPEQRMETRDFVTDLINSTVESLRPNISNPLEIVTELNLAFDDTLLLGTLDFLNLDIYGLNGLLIPYLNFASQGLISPGILDFEFVVPQLKVETLLETNVTVLGIMPVYGNGTASITLNYLQIKGSATALPIPLTVSDVSLQIHLENIELELHGLLESEEFSAFASSLLTDLGNGLIVTYLNDNAAEIGEAISQIINDILDGNSRITNSELQWIVDDLVTTIEGKLKDEIKNE